MKRANTSTLKWSLVLAVKTLLTLAVLGCCCAPIPLPLANAPIGQEEVETLEIEMVAGPAALR